MLVGLAVGELPAARITFPDGTTLATDHVQTSRIQSAALKRDVTLEAIKRSESPRASNKETSEEYWLDTEGLEHRDTVTDFNLPEGTLFDTAVVHILTKTTLDRLHELAWRPS